MKEVSMRKIPLMLVCGVVCFLCSCAIFVYEKDDDDEDDGDTLVIIRSIGGSVAGPCD
jgi:hypothetical protein